MDAFVKQTDEPYKKIFSGLLTLSLSFFKKLKEERNGGILCR